LISFTDLATATNLHSKNLLAYLFFIIRRARVHKTTNAYSFIITNQSHIRYTCSTNCGTVWHNKLL